MRKPSPFLIVVIICLAMMGCQSPADSDVVSSESGKEADRDTADSKFHPMAAEQGGLRAMRSKTETLRLTSIAIDCTSAITFTSEESSTKGVVFMGDACNRLADVTIGIEGKDEDLEFVRSSNNAGREFIEYANDHYRVLVELGVELSKQRMKDAICLPVSEKGTVRVMRGDEMLNVPSVIERACPYEESSRK